MKTNLNESNLYSENLTNQLQNESNNCKKWAAFSGVASIYYANLYADTSDIYYNAMKCSGQWSGACLRKGIQVNTNLIASVGLGLLAIYHLKLARDHSNHRAQLLASRVEHLVQKK